MPQAAREITINRLRTALGTDRHCSAMTPQGVTYMNDYQARIVTHWVQIIGYLVVAWTLFSVGSGAYAWWQVRQVESQLATAQNCASFKSLHLNMALHPECS